MAKDITLYWGSGSPPCWRVMIALEEKDLQGYHSKLLSFDKKEHKSKEVMDINPRGQLPAFKHGNNVVNESFAACQYLESQFQSQGTPLVLDGAEQQALMYQRMYEGQTLQQKLSDVNSYTWRVPEAERHDSVLRRYKEAATAELLLWEQFLKQVGAGPFLAGKSFSLADVIVFPVIAHAVRVGLPLDRYPQLGQYYSLLKDRPSIKASWPPHWLENPQGMDTLKDGFFDLSKALRISNMENIGSTYDDDEVTFIVCDVCNIKIRTEAIYRIHLTTSQHLKKEEALVAAGKARGEPPLPVWNSYTHYLDYLQLDEPIVGLKHLVEVETAEGSGGSRYLCRQCYYEADMPDMTNHIIGRKHRQKYLETHRPDLVTWDKSNASQPGKVVRPKAEVAERQDGRGVPEKLKKRPLAIGKTGALKVPSTAWRGKQPPAQGLSGGLQTPLHLHGAARHRDSPTGRGYPKEASYGRGYPESFASGEEWRAEQPGRRSQDKEGGVYPHGNTHELPVNSYPAYQHGDGMGPERDDYIEQRRGRVYEDQPRRGGVYEEERMRGGVYQDERKRGGAYSYAGQVSGSHMSAGSCEQDVGGAKWQRESPAGDGPNALPETFKRFLSGATEKHRVSRFSQDPEPSREAGLDSKRFKLDPLNLGKVDYRGKDSESGDVLDDLKNIDIESVEEANFIKQKLCNLLKEFQANKSQRERARRNSPSGFCRDYNHLSTAQPGPSTDLQDQYKWDLRKPQDHFERDQRGPQDHFECDQRGPQDHFERDQRGPQDHFEHDQRGPQDHFERDQSGPQDHFERDQRGPQDHFERDQRGSQDHFERDQRGPQDHFERNQRGPQDHFDRDQRGPQDHFERGQRESQDHFERDQRDPQDHFERGRRDPQDHFERGQRESQDHFERGQRDPQDPFERGQRDLQHHYKQGQRDSKDRNEEYGRGREDRYDPAPRGSRKRSEEGRVDPRAAHRDSYEDVFGKTAPDPKRSVHPYPQSSSLPDVWSPPQRMDRLRPPTEFDPHLTPTPPQKHYSSPENTASLDKITSTLLQLVARKRPF
ncbi:hypothetical protein SKAU_G00407510 [Synaphobranchus kaupii]|uniref:Uncharacterized protein n=1 Tax=Synaphobranchus kaupii TaxID=118154 RepID=A0A9Q1EA97_SYNKA|nr:hypothetical protein SKAU_G00407510 [Synaphobranchus kaupii]